MGIPSSANLYGQMSGLEKIMASYNLGRAPGEIQKALGNAVGNFKNQYNELGQAEARAYTLPGEVMNEYQMAQNQGQFQNPGVQGTQFTGVNPLDRINAGLGRVGQQFANVDTIGRGIDFQKGRLEDISNQIGNQYQLSYQQNVDKYNRLSPLLQTALQLEESRKARAAAARAASGYGFPGMQGGGAGVAGQPSTSVQLPLGGGARANARQYSGMQQNQMNLAAGLMNQFGYTDPLKGFGIEAGGLGNYGSRFYANQR